MAKHLLASLSMVIFSVSLLQAQEISDDQLIEVNHAKTFEEKNPLIPVSKGDRIILKIDRLFQTPVKKPVLENLIKGAGIAAMTYQSGNLLNSSKSKESKQTNWLIPLGATLTLSANKISQKSNKVYIKYSVFNSNKEELFFDILKVDKKTLRNNEQLIKTVESDGFVKVDVFMSGIEYSSKEITEVVHQIFLNENNLETDEASLSRKTYLKGDIERIKFEKPVLNQIVVAKDLSDKILSTISPLLNLKRTQKKSILHSPKNHRKKETNRTVETISLKNSDGNHETELIPLEASPLRIKQTPVDKKSSNSNTFFHFKWTNRRRIGKKNDDLIDDFDDDVTVFPPITKQTTSVPGVNGVGYGTGGDAIVYSSPRFSSSSGSYNYGGGSGGGDWEDSAQYYSTADPCYSMNSNCQEDFCIVNPTDPICCDQEDTNSPCFVPCPTTEPPQDSLLVDFKAFDIFLHNVIPPGIKTESLYLSKTTDSWGITYFQLSGAYSDANGNVTTFSKFNIGNPIPNPSVMGDIMRNDPAFTTYGDPINYNGGTVQNYYDPQSGRYYALWTDSQYPYAETVFPNSFVKDSLVTEGAAYTIPDPTSIWYPQSIIHMSTTNNGLATLQHEFGHYLQMMVFGLDFYTGVIMPTSLFSATFNPSKHSSKWTETGASALAKLFFGPNSKIALSTYHKNTICQ